MRQQTINDSQLAVQQTRELVKRFFAEIWNMGRLESIPQLCSTNLHYTSGSSRPEREGHDGLARMVQTIRTSLDNYHSEVISMVVEENKAFVKVRFSGKHVGFLMGYEPTGRQVEWVGGMEFTVRNGQILHVWELGDTMTLCEQLERG